MVPGRGMERCREAGGDLEDRESRESVDYNAVYQRPYGHVGREVKATSASRAACLAESEGPGSEICPSAEPWTLPGTSFILLGETQPKVPALSDARPWAFLNPFHPMFHRRCCRRILMAKGSRSHAMSAARTAQNIPQLNCRIRAPLEHYQNELRLRFGDRPPFLSLKLSRSRLAYTLL